MIVCKLASKKIKHLIVITGPTASGKTSLSIQLAKLYNTCILSADSRQFYKEITIGTAKPTKEEQDGVKHYFIDSHNLKDEVTSAQFEKEALEVLDIEFNNHDVIILTGGSGMFIDALCIGLDKIPSSSEIKTQIQSEYDESGLDSLLKELEQKDIEYYNNVDKNNPMRIFRALEVIRLTGKTYSELRKAKPTPRPFKIHRFVIEHERETLYNRINERVNLMINQGLLDEVESVQNIKHLSSLNTVGYKELFEFLDNKISLDEAIEKIKMNTRRYAKRQLTWFRKHENTTWIKFSTLSTMTQEITSKIESEIH